MGRPAGRPQSEAEKRHAAARPISVEIFETLIGLRHAGNTSRNTLSAALCEVLCDDCDLAAFFGTMQLNHALSPLFSPDLPGLYSLGPTQRHKVTCLPPPNDKINFKNLT